MRRHHVVGKVGKESVAVVPQPQRLQADRQQALLAGPRFTVGSEHSAGHPRRSRLTGCAVHPHRPAVPGSTASHRETDDAAADDSEDTHGVKSPLSLPPPA